jgi:hypothetical protein
MMESAFFISNGASTFRSSFFISNGTHYEKILAKSVQEIKKSVLLQKFLPTTLARIGIFYNFAKKT